MLRKRVKGIGNKTLYTGENVETGSRRKDKRHLVFVQQTLRCVRSRFTQFNTTDNIE